MTTKEIYLSKSDFKIAESCRTKLFYKKHFYPNDKQGNEYIAMLADQGYIVGLISQLMYENVVEIKGNNTKEAIEETEKLLFQNKKDVILFEPAISSNNKLVRIDILKKEKKEFSVIEVKSKSYNPKKHADAIAKEKSYFEDSNWIDYLEDLAYQKYTLEDKISKMDDYKDYTIRSFFYIPDKSKENKIEGFIGQFDVKPNEEVKKNPNKFSKKDIEFTGDVEELRKNDFLTLIEVTKEVENIITGIKKNAELYLEDIKNKDRFKTQISCKCSSCEYSVTNEEHKVSGFDECWGEMTNTEPHILDLYQLGNLNRKKVALNENGDIVDKVTKKDKVEKIGIIDYLIKNGKSSINDVSKENLIDKYSNRSYYQAINQPETLQEGFKEVYNNIIYPLWFIDFENTSSVIPFHEGMHPFEPVLFQWSCHKVESPDAEPVHYEWLNLDSYYPNFEFAKSLKNCIGDVGTVLTWSHHENTMLKTIINKLEYLEEKEPVLMNWLENMESRIVDMNQVAINYYFHPFTKGKTSIKVTLPAVLQGMKSKRVEKWLQEHNLVKGINLFERDLSGVIINPYNKLPPFNIPGTEVYVHHGGEAMIAYKDMLYGVNKGDDDIRNKYRDALLEYCKLDTLAMVIIWERWKEINK